MDKFALEQILPQISVVLPTSSTEEDARAAARDLISNVLNLDFFEILHIELTEEGILKTKEGVKEGKRYRVAFRQLHEEVIYVHPDYDKIINSFC